MVAVGYQYIVNTFRLDAPRIKRPARIRPLTRIEWENDHVGIPRHVAPSSDRPIDHLLFALRHEGPNLGILMPALRQVPAADVLAEVRAHRTGAYARWMACLWEYANGQQLTDLPEIGGWVAPLFAPDQYMTRSPSYIPRWRLHFNGLGSLDYCATVEKTEAVLAGVKSNVPARATAFVDELNQEMRSRALTYAYLSETESSFRIEHDMPDETRRDRFVTLLKRAHERHDLSEDHLCDLQRATINNPLDLAFEYRSAQNYLSRAGRHRNEVTYVPPPPDLTRALMGELLTFANRPDQAVDPLVMATVVSFGFVFLHPFMDGNGRLSRYLLHSMLCKTGALKDGMILPVSMAIEADEPAYLHALQSFSRESLRAWEVRASENEEPQFRYRWNDGLAHYRYWDATACVEFGYAKAEQALRVGLQDEARFLQQFDTIYKAVNARFDLRQSVLVNLVRMAIEQGGRLSNHRRKQFLDRVPDGAFDVIEEIALAVLRPDDPATSPEQQEICSACHAEPCTCEKP